MAIVTEDGYGLSVQVYVAKGSDTYDKLKVKADQYREHIGEPEMSFERAVDIIIEGVLSEGWTL